eukprot:scaffold20489_cov107-Isochrysis_galbana.AAC.1
MSPPQGLELASTTHLLFKGSAAPPTLPHHIAVKHDGAQAAAPVQHASVSRHFLRSRVCRLANNPAVLSGCRAVSRYSSCTVACCLIVMHPLHCFARSLTLAGVSRWSRVPRLPAIVLQLMQAWEVGGGNNAHREQ